MANEFICHARLASNPIPQVILFTTLYVFQSNFTEKSITPYLIPRQLAHLSYLSSQAYHASSKHAIDVTVMVWKQLAQYTIKLLSMRHSILPTEFSIAMEV